MSRPLSFLLAATVAAIACGSETEPEGHTPAAAKLFVAGQEITPNLVLARGQTVRIEVRFYHDDGDLITGIEDHFAGLSFAPSALATVVRVAGTNFSFDVTAQNAAGSGTASVGYGRDAAADEHVLQRRVPHNPIVMVPQKWEDRHTCVMERCRQCVERCPVRC